MSLTDTQLDRYARHIILKEIGGAGQQRLLGATVALVLIRALFPGLTATEAEEIFTPSYESGAS